MKIPLKLPSAKKIISPLSFLLRVASGVNKYIVTTVVFVVIVVFADEYSVVQRYKNIAKITQLEKEVKFYQKQIDGFKQQLEELESDNENLEKYAREQYFMKRPNEDVYIIK